MEQQNYYDVGLSQDPSEWVFSNSSLGYINPSEGGHPRKLMAFFNEKAEEETSKSLERGKLLHLYMENPETFAISNVPKPTDKLSLACDGIIADLITMDNPEITNEVILANVRNVGWNNRWSDEAILKNTKDPIVAYVNEVLTNRDKQILSESTANILKECIKSIQNHEVIQALVYSKNENSEVFTEQSIFWEDKFKRKAKLDRFIVDRVAKKINHFDFKTTSKPISLFEVQFESYRYYRQFAYYDTALKNFLISIGENPNDWKIVHSVIVVETIAPYCAGVFEVEQFWLDEGYKEIENLNAILDVHYLHNNFVQTHVEIMNHGINKFRNVRRHDAWY